MVMEPGFRNFDNSRVTRRLLPFATACVIAAAAATAVPWDVAASIAGGPFALALPVFLAIACVAGLLDRRSRGLAAADLPVEIALPAVSAAAVEIPRQRVAVAVETLSTAAVAGVAARG